MSRLWHVILRAFKYHHEQNDVVEVEVRPLYANANQTYTSEPTIFMAPV